MDTSKQELNKLRQEFALDYLKNMKVFFISSILFTLISIYGALPQWQPLNVDRFDKDGFTLSKNYNFNKGLSSIGGIGGYDKTKGIGLGLQGSHKFGQGTQISGGLFKSQHGGLEKALGLKHTFKTGTSLFGSGSYAPNFKSHTFGIGQKIGQGTSLFGSQTNSNYGGFKVKSHQLGISHKFKSGATINAFGGKSSFGGNSFGLGVKLPFGKKK